MLLTDVQKNDFQIIKPRREPKFQILCPFPDRYRTDSRFSRTYPESSANTAWAQWGEMKCLPCTPEFVSASPLLHGWSSAAQIRLEWVGMPDGARRTDSHWPRYGALLWNHAELGAPQLRFKIQDRDGQFKRLTSASRDDMNLRTTCLRYSKLISRESLRSAVLVTLVLKGCRFWEDAGGGSGQTLSCLSARISGDFSRASVSGSDFSLYNEYIARARVVSCRFLIQNAVVEQKQLWSAEESHQLFLQRPL